jgi:hypothetical protein
MDRRVFSTRWRHEDRKSEVGIRIEDSSKHSSRAGGEGLRPRFPCLSVSAERRIDSGPRDVTSFLLLRGGWNRTCPPDRFPVPTTAVKREKRNPDSCAGRGCSDTSGSQNCVGGCGRRTFFGEEFEAGILGVSARREREAFSTPIRRSFARAAGSRKAVVGSQLPVADGREGGSGERRRRRLTACGTPRPGRCHGSTRSSLHPTHAPVQDVENRVAGCGSRAAGRARTLPGECAPPSRFRPVLFACLAGVLWPPDVQVVLPNCQGPNCQGTGGRGVARCRNPKLRLAMRATARDFLRTLFAMVRAGAGGSLRNSLHDYPQSTARGDGSLETAGVRIRASRRSGPTACRMSRWREGKRHAVRRRMPADNDLVRGLETTGILRQCRKGISQTRTVLVVRLGKRKSLKLIGST